MSCWVVRNKTTGEFVAIEPQNGYLYHVTNFWDAKFFKEEYKAHAFAARNGGKVYRADQILTECKAIDPYEIELLALKKKYGRE